MKKHKSLSIPSFEIGQLVKIQIHDENCNGKKKKVVSGNVIYKTEKFIVVMTKNYREGVNLIDFATGRAAVLGG